MGFADDVADVTRHPSVRRLAMQRARSRELAEDALQETFWSVSRTRSPEAIADLYAYFCRALIQEIGRKHKQPTPSLSENIDTTANIQQARGSHPGASPPPSVENEASLRLLAEQMLKRLDSERDRLSASVPARSDHPQRYKGAIIAAARKLLCLLLLGDVARPDWNAVIMSEYPSWCDEPGLDSSALDKRLSRARNDVRSLLQIIVPRAELTLR